MYCNINVDQMYCKSKKWATHCFGKVRIFREGHKIWKKSSIYFMAFSECPNFKSKMTWEAHLHTPVKKDSKNGAGRNIFGPSYFVTTVKHSMKKSCFPKRITLFHQCSKMQIIPIKKFNVKTFSNFYGFSDWNVDLNVR